MDNVITQSELDDIAQAAYLGSDERNPEHDVRLLLMYIDELRAELARMEGGGLTETSAAHVLPGVIAERDAARAECDELQARLDRITDGAHLLSDKLEQVGLQRTAAQVRRVLGVGGQ